MKKKIPLRCLEIQVYDVVTLTFRKEWILRPNLVEAREPLCALSPFRIACSVRPLTCLGRGGDREFHHPFPFASPQNVLLYFVILALFCLKSVNLFPVPIFFS